MHTGDEEDTRKDDRDQTKTDSTDLDLNTWGNKLNYETILVDRNTIKQVKNLGHGSDMEQKHNTTGMDADSRVPTNSGGAGKGGDRNRESKSKSDREDPEVLGGACDRGGDPEGRDGAGATED